MSDLCDKVASELRMLGFNAVSWNAGGGVFGVGIARGDSPPDELTFFFGTAGDAWEGEILNSAGEVAGMISTAVAADCSDPRHVAAGIADSIAQLAASNAALPSS